MAHAAYTVDAVREAVGRIVDPELDRPLAELRFVRDVAVDAEGRTTLQIELPTPAYPGRERLTERIREAIAGLGGDPDAVDVAFSAVVRGKESGGRIGLKIKNVLAVGSGKGGVGKSTIAAALAYGLKHYGAKVGLMDADVYGPSIPHLLGARGEPAMVQRQGPDGRVVNRIEPVECDGLKLMSMGFLIRQDQAVVWRGPMLHKALSQFLQDTEWGELDYLVIDLPPGTGDVSLSLSQLLGLAGAVIVCTPQKVALLDAVKAVSMFRQVKIPLLGVVENMTGDIFGRGGARRLAEEAQIPFLGEVPSDPEIRIQGDEGRFSELFASDTPTRQALLHVCQRTAMEIARQLLDSPQMPSLEIL